MDNDYRKAANLTVIAAGIVIFIWIFLKYAFGAVLPFLIATIIAAIIAPITDGISKSTKLPAKPIAAVLTVLIFSAIASIFYFATSRAIKEVGNLIERLSQDPEIISNAIDKITDKFDFLSKLFNSEAIKELGLDADKLLIDALSSLMSSLTSYLPSAAINLVAKIPEILLFIAVLLISTYYFCTDRKSIFTALTSLLPDKWQNKLPLIKRRTILTFKGYFKAYLFIMLMTFCEVFIGLSLLGVNYAFLLSIIIAVVDILPILGTGTVLVPWALFSFITSNNKLGIGLLILYAAVSIIRQFAEPKIVGNTLGLHPLATLASIYLGISFFGIVGIFIGPIAALFLQNLFKSENDTKSDRIVIKKERTP